MGITHTYEYDSLGNITSIYDGSKTTTYKYDALNQLVRADNPYENKTHIYTYENGNITEDKVYEYTTGNLPEYPESKTQYLYENVTWSDILTGVRKSHFDNGVEIIDDRYSISSDTIGNITNLNGSEYSWLGRQLQSVSNSDNSNTTYSYNADGQRIAKAVNSANGDEYNYGYYYNGDILAGYKLVITKSDGSSTTHNIAFMYDENGEAFGFNYNGNDYYYVRNAQNDVVRIVDSANETVVLYQYDSWGKLLSCEDTSENDIVSFINPYTYRGYYYDSDTEMYFLKSRYYNPELHRFISADSVVAGVGAEILGYNMFAYCLNNPVNMSDDNGNWPKWIKKVSEAISTMIHSVVSHIQSKIDSSNVRLSKKATNRPDSGLVGVPDEEIQRKARDRNLPGKERNRYKEEEKVRGLRNKQKRGNKITPEKVGKIVCGTAIVTVATIGVVYIVANDVTGLGVVDDVLIVPLTSLLNQGTILIFQN